MAYVTFGIPLVSRRVAPDWASVENLLAMTLGSIFGQEGADVRVIIACHESPDLAVARDPRVTIVNVDFDIPRWKWEMQIDQMRKTEVIGAAHRAAGAGILFILDADDFASRHLARDLLASSCKSMFVQRGYRLDARRGMYQQLEKFYGKCGSCAAVNWSVSELPVTPLGDNPSVFHEMIEHRHFEWPAFFRSQGWTVEALARPAIVYNVNHGSNQSDVNIRLSFSWWLRFNLMRWRRWTDVLDQEFSIDRSALLRGIYEGTERFSVARTAS